MQDAKSIDKNQSVNEFENPTTKIYKIIEKIKNVRFYNKIY